MSLHRQDVRKLIHHSHTGHDFAGIQVFAQQHGATDGLRTGHDDGIKNRQAAGLVLIEPCSNDGGCTLYDLKPLKYIHLSPNMVGGQLEFFECNVAVLL